MSESCNDMTKLSGVFNVKFWTEKWLTFIKSTQRCATLATRIFQARVNSMTTCLRFAKYVLPGMSANIRIKNSDDRRHELTRDKSYPG